MNIMEIILLAAGVIIFVASFFIPEKKGAGDGNGKVLAEDEIKKLVNQELESLRSHVDDVVEEAVTYAMEKTERSLERLSNEKIMAVSEYSDTVLAEIHKDHEEAMFLYDMLNNKQVSLKNTVSEIDRTIKEAEETITNFQKLTPETVTSQAEEEPQREVPVKETPVAEAAANKTSGGKNRSKRNSSRKSSSNKNSSGRGAGVQAASAVNYAGNSTGQQQVQGESVPGGQEQTEKSGEQDAQNQQYNSNERILALYKEGKSALQIAKVLDIGVGEVELVLDLFQK